LDQSHFNYTARDPAGTRVSGKIMARNLEEALCALQDVGVYVTNIEPIPLGDRWFERNHRVVLPSHERSLLLESWARMLESGIPMESALFNLQAVVRRPSARRAAMEIQRLIQQGLPFGEAVAASGLLPPTWAGVLEAGQKRGDFVGPLVRLRKRSDQIRQTIRQVIMALLMPTVLILAVLVCFGIFVLWLAPVMAQSIRDFTGAENPLLEGLQRGSAMLLPSLVVSGLGLCLLTLMAAHGNRADTVMGTLPTWVPTGFPWVGPLISKVHLLVITSELQLQLEAGIPISTALVTLAGIIRRPSLHRELLEANRRVSKGVPVWQALAELQVMPSQAAAALSAGYASGKLPEMLGVLAREADLDLQTGSQRLAIKVRSGVILAAGVLVALLTFGVMTVILSVMESLVASAAANAPR